MNNQEETNICKYCKWTNLHTYTGRSCEEAMLTGEKTKKVRNKMARLTFKNPNGTWGLNNGYDMKKVPSDLYGALWKLKEYEETGLSPEKIEEMDRLYLEKCEEVNRLAKEKDAREAWNTREPAEDSIEQSKMTIRELGERCLERYNNKELGGLMCTACPYGEECDDFHEKNQI